MNINFPLYFVQHIKTGGISFCSDNWLAAYTEMLSAVRFGEIVITDFQSPFTICIKENEEIRPYKQLRVLTGLGDLTAVTAPTEYSQLAAHISAAIDAFQTCRLQNSQGLFWEMFASGSYGVTCYNLKNVTYGVTRYRGKSVDIQKQAGESWLAKMTPASLDYPFPFSGSLETVKQISERYLAKEIMAGKTE